MKRSMNCEKTLVGYSTKNNVYIRRLATLMCSEMFYKHLRGGRTPWDDL